jgi:HD-GYP domain-containing protein (c-di-GMP phosphodiesterase class II)
MSSTKQRINCNQLTIGMHVVELDRPWIDSPFTVHGFKIQSSLELKRLQEYCQHVFINVPKSIDTAGKDLSRRHYTNTLSFEHALPQAKVAHRQAKSTMKGFLKNLRLGQDFDSTVAKKAVKQCVDSVIANEDAMLWLTLLKNVDEYTAQHSLNVGLLSIVLGRAEGLPPAELEIVGLCGMLHDMGKSQIPLEVLNKEGAFSHDEFAIMKTHTTLGYEILKQKPDIAAIAAEVAHCHHERLNGKGYPRSIPANQISYYTRIVAIADCYDAITSKRVYSPAKTSLEALTILMGAKGSHFDPALVDSFIKCIGIYPAGAIAELSTREVAIILPTPQMLNATPKILIVRDRKKEPCQEHIVDLSKKPTDDNNKQITIKHLLSDGMFGINLNDYHEQITTAISQA